MPLHKTVIRIHSPGASLARRTGVSLHGHTLHSREGMLFIRRIAESFPPLRSAIDLAARRRGCAGISGVAWDRVYWTPPLAPRQAYEVEANQILGLGLDPLVSLTDHDDISAPAALSALPDLSERVPISVEWTFPFGETFFHLGVHNLPAGNAKREWNRLAAAARSGDRRLLLSLLREIRSLDGTLLVLNHPYWDEKGIGQSRHESALYALLGEALPWLDALELNGFRPAGENRAAAECARRTGLPLVSGGDRHGIEPSSCLNLTDAASFAEFAAEVRHEKRSEILLMPHYFHHRAFRVIQHIAGILRDDPDHGLGWRRWDDRMFFRDKRGVVRSLREFWNGRPPALASAFVGVVRLMGHEPVRQAVRAALGEEGSL